MFVKICGITSRDAIEAAVTAGADAVGFVFAPSPRRIEPDAARSLCAGLPAGILRVAVMRHPSAAEAADVLRRFAPDWLQTDAEDFAAIELPRRCAGLPVYRSGRPPRSGEPRRILFEGTDSGTGKTADWSAARLLAGEHELILAGGLDADNVGDAIRQVGPWGVDVSSGVEATRGRKDPEKIAQFVARVRALERT